VTELERRTALALLAGGALGAGTACAQSTPGTEKKIGEPALCPEVLGKQLRVARPGQSMTMEYRADRLTIEVDDKDRIVSIRVG
jgi:Peptidase inhibitor I78 family